MLYVHREMGGAHLHGLSPIGSQMTLEVDVPNFKTRRTFFAMALSTAALAACGGGGDGDGDGDDDDAGSSKDLLDAYNKIQKGMSYDEVVRIVGYAHNAGENRAGRLNLTIYVWDAGAALPRLTISIADASGVSQKHYIGKDGLINSSDFR